VLARARARVAELESRVDELEAKLAQSRRTD
jgi:BMFP domain-containing protein YqiC